MVVEPERGGTVTRRPPEPGAGSAPLPSPSGSAASDAADGPAATPEFGLLAILADDLTGACDSAVPFARHGLATRVLLAARPVEAERSEPLDVVALDADSRQVARRLAVVRTTLAARALRAPGDGRADRATAATRLFKKVDSTLRGHVGPELAACLRAWELPLAVLCPAFPATGRWVQHGEIFVDGRGSLGAVARLAGLPADRRTAHVELTTVRAGADAVADELARLARAGARVVIADADTPGHLTTLVDAVARGSEPILLAGAGGLAAALAERTAARRLAAGSGPGRPAGGAASPSLGGAPDWPSAPALDGLPWLVVVGTQTEVTHHQVVELARAGAQIVPLDVAELLARPIVAAAAGRRAAALLRQDVTPVLRLVVPPNADGVATLGRHLDERAARALARACRATVERERPAGLFLTGGSTARAALVALGVIGLRLEREPLPGIAAGVALGGAWDGRPVITKSGGFGAPDAIRRLVRPRSPQRLLLAATRPAYDPGRPPAGA